MKVNISCGASNMVNRSRKSMKLLSHLKKKAPAEEFETVQQEFNTSFDSTGSIQILDGSFSKLKPIDSKRTTTTISSSAPVVDRPGKSIKLLLHLKKESGSDEFQTVQDEVNANFSSANSGIKVLNGSKRAATPYEGASATNTPFKPATTSTPYHYEDISDAEVENKNIQEDTDEDEALNITFNYQEDVLEENESSNAYVQQVVAPTKVLKGT